MKVYLVRHGQTDGNRDRILQSPDTPLSDLGHRQAQQLAAAFEDVPVDGLLCSVHTRARQTLSPLLAHRNCVVEYSDLLTERNFGDLRGRRYDDIKEDFFADGFHPPNGESVFQFRQRINQTWRFILDKSEQLQGDLLVITHGLVLRELLSQCVGVEPLELQRAGFANTCVTEVELDLQPKVLRLCDISHLDEAALSSLGAEGKV